MSIWNLFTNGEADSKIRILPGKRRGVILNSQNSEFQELIKRILTMGYNQEMGLQELIEEIKVELKMIVENY